MWKKSNFYLPWHSNSLYSKTTGSICFIDALAGFFFFQKVTQKSILGYVARIGYVIGRQCQKLQICIFALENEVFFSQVCGRIISIKIKISIDDCWLVRSEHSKKTCVKFHAMKFWETEIGKKFHRIFFKPSLFVTECTTFTPFNNLTVGLVLL